MDAAIFFKATNYGNHRSLHVLLLRHRHPVLVPHYILGLPETSLNSIDEFDLGAFVR